MPFLTTKVFMQLEKKTLQIIMNYSNRNDKSSSINIMTIGINANNRRVNPNAVTVYYVFITLVIILRLGSRSLK